MGTRSIVDTLRELRGGAMLDDASESLHRLVMAVRDTGKPGKLTITLSVKPLTASNSEILSLEDTVVISSPKPALGATVMFTTKEGNLSRRDPRQAELPIEAVRSLPPEVANG